MRDSLPTVGAPVSWTNGYTGTGRTVAVIDTGVQSTHPFLSGQVVAEACLSGNFDQPELGVCPGPDPTFAVGVGTGQPCTFNGCEHGTHVAGTVAGKNGPLTAPSGVAPGTKIFAIQTASRNLSSTQCNSQGLTAPCPAFYDVDLVDALWQSFNNANALGLAAVNLSLGGGQFTSACDGTLPNYAEMINALRNVGVATVAATGNNGFTSSISAPACIASAVRVGNVDDSTLQVWGSSNSSSQLDLLAPGRSIQSSVPGGGFASFTGTSMATPHVAGAFAVMGQAYPGATVTQVLDQLKGTGRPITDARNGITRSLVQLDEAVPKSKGTFHPLDPVRLLDTRTGNGAPRARLGPGQVIELQVTGRGGVPSTGVSAVVLNVTAVAPSAVGYVTLWPTGSLRPLASNLNLTPADVRPNLVTVRTGAHGRVSLFNANGSVDLVADVSGWYDRHDAGGNSGARYRSVVPTRVLDTRDGTGAAAGEVGPGGSVTLDVTDQPGSPVPGDATAVILNVTATDATTGTYITAWPAAEARPLASNLNLGPGQTRPNLVTVKLSDDGSFSLYNNLGTVHLVADVQGWYTNDPSAARFVARTPTRLLDTRAGTPLGPATTRNLQVTNVANVPAGASAIVVNFTAVNPSAAGFVTVYPGDSSLPLASNLNLVPHVDTPNLVVARVPSSGQLRYYNDLGTTHFVADVAGWFE
jgi:hypothetical protein